MGIPPDYNLGQVELMKAEIELGRADEPPVAYNYMPLTTTLDWNGDPCVWIDVQPDEVHLILTPWVEEGPDYLAITRDVAGG